MYEGHDAADQKLTHHWKSTILQFLKIQKKKVIYLLKTNLLEDALLST